MDDGFEDQVRDRIRRALADAGMSESALSERLGKNRTYINDYMKSRSPRRLPHETKVEIGKLLKIDRKDLGVDQPAAAAHGQHALAEDAVPYSPGPAGALISRDHTYLYQVTTPVLDQHPERVMPGAILVVDLNDVALAGYETGDIVIFSAIDKRKTGSATTLVREWVSPNKLITNSSAVNEIIRIDDPALPYILAPRGRVLSITRDLSSVKASRNSPHA